MHWLNLVLSRCTCLKVNFLKSCFFFFFLFFFFISQQEHPPVEVHISIIINCLARKILMSSNNKYFWGEIVPDKDQFSTEQY